MATKEQVIEYLDQCSAHELVQIMDDFREVTGIEMPLALPQGPPPPKEEAEPEQTEFDVKLVSFGDKKMAVIKEVRAQTGLGLKEAKELVEGLGVIREAVGKEQAEELAKIITAAGGEVELK